MVQNIVRTRTLRQSRIRPFLLAAVCLLFLLLSVPTAGPEAKAEETFPYDAIRDALTGTLNEEAGEFSAAAFTILGSEEAGDQTTLYLKASALRYGFMGGYCVPISGWKGPCTAVVMDLRGLWLLTDLTTIESYSDIEGIFSPEAAKAFFETDGDWEEIDRLISDEAEETLRHMGRSEKIGTVTDASGELPNIVTVASNLLGSLSDWPLGCTYLEKAEPDGRMIYEKTWEADSEDNLVTLRPDGSSYDWGGTTGTLTFTKTRKDTGLNIFTITARATVTELVITLSDEGGLIRYILPVVWGEDGAPHYEQPVVRRENSCRASADLIERMVQYLPGERQDLSTDIGRTNAETIFKGWTMGYYESQNYGVQAYAVYYRIQKKALTLRYVTLSAATGVAEQTDSLPIPLSASFMESLDTAGPDGLFSFSKSGLTFLTEDAVDRNILPLEGRVIQIDPQPDTLIILTQSDLSCRLWVAEKAGGSWFSVRFTLQLPVDTSLDLVQRAFGQVWLNWNALYSQCVFERSADGAWSLTRVRISGEYYTVSWTGIRGTTRTGEEIRAFGTFPSRDLFECDLLALPSTAVDAAALLDTTGIAAVNNPDSEDRLNLRESADRASVSLGSFRNGTPVTVLSDEGEWCLVRIGIDPGLSGWMMKQYLAFGDEAPDISQSDPGLKLSEDYLGAFAAGPDGKEKALTGQEIILGTGEDSNGGRLFILLADDGHVLYAPEIWYISGADAL